MQPRRSTHQDLPGFTGQVGIGLFCIGGAATYGKTHDKPGAHSILDADRAAMGGHETLDYVEADPCPVLLGATKTDKSVKDPGSIGDWHPLSLIGHRDPRLAVSGPNLDGYRPSRGAVLDRIIDEVVQNPMKLEEVASHNRFPGLHETKRERRMKRCQRFDGLARQTSEVKSFDLEPGHSLLNLTQVEKLIQEFDEPGGFVSYICDRLACRPIVGYRVQFGQYCCETSDSGKWRPHVVSHPHQEVEPFRQHLLNLRASGAQPRSPSITPM